MTVKDEIFVSFWIYKFKDDPEKIKRLLDIKTIEFYGEDDPYPGAAKRLTIKSGLNKNVAAEKQIENLLKILSKSKVVLKELSDKYQCQINVACYFYEPNPQFFIDKIILKKISDLNIDLYFDMYNMAEVADSN